MTKLYPGRIYDVTTTAITHKRGGPSLDARINGLLARWGFWRLGHSNGKWALLRVAPPYRQVVVWPFARAHIPAQEQA